MTYIQDKLNKEEMKELHQLLEEVNDMNYIQDKLDEFDEKVNNTYEFFNATDGGGDLQYTINEIDIDGVRDFIQQSLTDYHNHIVEILEKERQTWAKESIGEVAVKSIINRLQDTNPKE